MATDFLADLLQVINQQTTSDSEGVDVAHIGNLLLRDGKSWKANGFFRLSAALGTLEQRNRVSLFRSANGALRVKPVTATQSTPSPFHQGSLPKVPEGTAFQPLKSSVWFAFAVSTGQHQLINRRDGRVWYDLSAPPPPAIDWVRAEAVPEEEQKRWASVIIAGLEQPDVRSTLENTLKGQNWFRDFPDALNKMGTGLARSWSQVRSAGIIDQVKAWATKNNIPQHLLFVSTLPKARITKPALSNAMPADVGNIREVLLQAIGQMTTEDLLALTVPAGLLLKIARPEFFK